MGRWPILHSMLAVAGVVAGLAAAPGSSLAAGRYEYRVVGVEDTDTLNIRERPEGPHGIAGAKIIGRIPPNVSGVVGSGATQRIGTSRWFEVRFGAVRGWVNGRFLQPLAGRLGRELESDLFCAGTEPFWSLKVEQDAAEFKRPDAPAERYSIAAREPFQGRGDTLALKLVSDSGSISALVQHKEWCSDGMSDVEYAFEVRAVGVGGNDRPRRGCCILVR